MNLINAIAKVRFASARPQRVGLHKGEKLRAELLCLEPGQDLRVDSGEWVYYVVNGTAEVAGPGGTAQASAGQISAGSPGEAHAVSNVGDRRLICLVVGVD